MCEEQLYGHWETLFPSRNFTAKTKYFNLLKDSVWEILWAYTCQETKMRIRFIKRIPKRLFNAWLCWGVKSNHHQKLAREWRSASERKRWLGHKSDILLSTHTYFLHWHKVTKRKAISILMYWFVDSIREKMNTSWWKYGFFIASSYIFICVSL